MPNKAGETKTAEETNLGQLCLNIKKKCTVNGIKGVFNSRKCTDINKVSGIVWDIVKPEDSCDKLKGWFDEAAKHLRWAYGMIKGYIRGNFNYVKEKNELGVKDFLDISTQEKESWDRAFKRKFHEVDIGPFCEGIEKTKFNNLIKEACDTIISSVDALTNDKIEAYRKELDKEKKKQEEKKKK